MTSSCACSAGAGEVLVALALLAGDALPVIPPLTVDVVAGVLMRADVVLLAGADGELIGDVGVERVAIVAVIILAHMLDRPGAHPHLGELLGRRHVMLVGIVVVGRSWL